MHSDSGAFGIAVDPAAPAVILSPHLDDAVWSTFSLLVGEVDVVVATVFAGVPDGDEPGWWDAQCGILDSAEHVRARRHEDAAVLSSLGRTAVHLDLVDGQYRDGPIDPERVVEELHRAVTTVSRVYAPTGIGHPDHEIVRDAGVLLARAGVPTTLYTDYCYCTREGWPTWIADDGRSEADEQWRTAFGDIVGDELARPRVQRLTAEQSVRKLEAMKGYVTQYENIEAEEPNWQVNGRPPSDPAMRVIEVFYDLPAAVPAAR
jgi:LmbE family N-acetylglucosaminyl deacetylase